MTAAQTQSTLGTGKTLNPAKDSARIDALVGAAVGLAAFFAFGFHHVVSPHSTGWLLYWSNDEWYYDPSTVYLGWEFFRHTPWHFPLGLSPSYGLEYGSSIVFSDSIPLLAVLFKPFSPWLGGRFQYVGMWILACFVLQGLFGGLLASRISRQRIPRLLITCFIVTSPILLERAWTEYSLMGHWLVLWAIYLYLAESKRRVRWEWMALAALGTGTTFYFVPMVAAIWAADALRKLLRNWRAAGWVLLEGVGCLVVLMLTMWALGYQAIPFKSGGTLTYGNFAANLLGPLDPWDWSTILPRVPHAPNLLGEGFCYIGAGVLILGIVALIRFVCTSVSRRALMSRQTFFRFLPLELALLALTAFAVSNKVAFGRYVLEIPLPHNVWKIAGTFRASCRMFWPAYYVYSLAFLYGATRNLRPWIAALVLGAALMIQIADLAPLYSGIRARYNAERTWETPLKNEFWGRVPQRYRQIVVVRSYDRVRWVPLASLASANDMSTNCVLVSRFDSTSGRVVKTSDARNAALRENRLDRQTLYVIPDDERFGAITKTLISQHGFGQIDGYNVIAPYWFSDGDGAIPVELKHGPK